VGFNPEVGPLVSDMSFQSFFKQPAGELPVIPYFSEYLCADL
jgi:hypothetical protein